ncbi:hypothetical protein [Campylobacter hyointestinalis]|nr:hypothetical protein [Campylobacter hyointestinalis]
MPSLNWVGKDEVLNHNPAYYTLEKNILKVKNAKKREYFIC